ncbi:catalase [Plutella xylostella]|uniref:catalase n=1 Tax=Plutella xylostella TaxID=51655 RepID=UPI002032AF23|nr:catalase [Plutella xylostella]
MVSNFQGHPELLSISTGYPVDVEEASSSLNHNLIRHQFFLETTLHLSMERIPERVMHAPGTGAFGFFHLTHDLSHICKAKLFSRVGKKTPVGVRFSHVAGFRGLSDTVRDGRGFAVKFYTEDGNFDMVGLNSPVFPILDPLFFTSFVHVLHPNPKTGVMDQNPLWDFLTLRPESALFSILLFSDRGTPAGYRHMPGFSIHTYQVVNERGHPSFMRLHFLPDGGMKNLLNDEATRLAGEDPNYYTRDLYNAIAEGDFPTWTVAAQILSLEQVKKAHFDVFDVTKFLPLEKYPLHPIGQLVLNKNPENAFAEVEQIALNPGNLVPGILGAPDKMFEGRMLSYKDAQAYRLNGNLNKIAVNSPLKRPFTYNRDGQPPVADNELDAPNYFPNSFHGPAPYVSKGTPKLIEIVQHETDNVLQAREFYGQELTQLERATLPGNVVASLRAVAPHIQERAVKMFYLIDKELGHRIEIGLKNATSKCGLFH